MKAVVSKHLIIQCHIKSKKIFIEVQVVKSGQYQYGITIALVHFDSEENHLNNQGTDGKAIYPTFSFLSHSCSANGRWVILYDLCG